MRVSLGEAAKRCFANFFGLFVALNAAPAQLNRFHSSRGLPRRRDLCEPHGRFAGQANRCLSVNFRDCAPVDVSVFDTKEARSEERLSRPGAAPNAQAAKANSTAAEGELLLILL